MALTPFHGYLTTYEKCTVKIKGISHENMVIGHGKVHWCLKDDFVKDTRVENWAYHVPTADVLLIASQY